MVSHLGFVCAGAFAALFSVSSVQAADVSAVQEVSADAAGIKVVLNHAKVLKLSRPAGTVVIGNPEIADATIQDAETIVLTGRGFGRTNIVILDSNGTPILDENVAVGRDSGAAIRIYRRAEIENLSCEPECEGAYLTEAETQAIAATSRANRARFNNN